MRRIIFVISASMILTGCNNVESVSNFDEIQTETILTENILVENIIVETIE